MTRKKTLISPGKKYQKLRVLKKKEECEVSDDEKRCEMYCPICNYRWQLPIKNEIEPVSCIVCNVPLVYFSLTDTLAIICPNTVLDLPEIFTGTKEEFDKLLATTRANFDLSLIKKLIVSSNYDSVINAENEQIENGTGHYAVIIVTDPNL